jgi:hypothetical protein
MKLKKITAVLFSLVILVFFTACGSKSISNNSNNSKPDPTPSQPANRVDSVTVSPSSAMIQIGASQEIKVTVAAYGNASTAVTYIVSDGTCSVKSGSANVYVFKPNTVSGQHTVIFKSVFDSSKSATATITVMAVGINISPQNPPVSGGILQYMRYLTASTGSAYGVKLIEIPSGFVTGINSVDNGVSTSNFVFLDKTTLDITNNSLTLPNSAIEDGFYDPASQKVFFTGYTGNKEKAFLTAVSTATQQMIPAKYFQINGTPTEGKFVSVRNSEIRLGVESDYKVTSFGNIGYACPTGSWIITLDMDGNRKIDFPDFPVGDTEHRGGLTKAPMTGMLVFDNIIWAVGDVISSDGSYMGVWIGNWTHKGESTPVGVAPPSLLFIGFGAKVFPNPLYPREQTVLVAMNYFVNMIDSNQYNKWNMFFEGYDAVYAWSAGPGGQWNGDNSGYYSFNRFRDFATAAFSGQNAYVMVGELSKIGNTTPTPTDAGIFGYKVDGTLWKKRFNDLTNNQTVETLNSIVYSADGSIYSLGSGSNGSAASAVIVKIVP